MKLRKAWRYIIRTADGTDWFGNCPNWANEPLPEGATLTRQRVLALGTPKPCTYPTCCDLHMALPQPN